ncbi:hypothetical protein OG264_16165 [Streptomyces xanthophaeus]|uniref:hypothetical protein n=1 Tax=Streptomyces xanthophaeus TaxID=67385 RepID=UPI003870C70E|nr:hypothetical protein OG264_16165 [Streptomyces xanthophaeus]WST62130.1 hypothetical protein OG605_22270 [Streptomyces xanthophaeus]
MNRTSMAEWLASSHPEPDQVWAEWRDRGVAVIPLGPQYGAVRIPEAVVYAAAESSDPDDVGVVLAQALDGPVIHDARGRNFYMLVRSDTLVDWGRTVAGVEQLGPRTHLGVPASNRCENSPHTPVYWAVPGLRPGHCDPNAVGLLIRRGAELLSEAAR